MSADIDAAVDTKIHTTKDGRVIIEQSNNSIVLTSAEQILAVIKELNVCYDYCAAWKKWRRMTTLSTLRSIREQAC